MLLIKGNVYSPDNSHIKLQVWRADTVLTRMRGLLGRAMLQEQEGLWITPCNAIHTWGMRYALDICFLDRQGVIIELVKNKAPWGMSACFSSYATLELKAGEIDRQQLNIGMQLQWQNT